MRYLAIGQQTKTSKVKIQFEKYLAATELPMTHFPNQTFYFIHIFGFMRNGN